MNSLPKQLALRLDLWTVARILFLLSVVYSVLVDIPLALENILATKSRPPTYHFVAPEYAYTFSTPSWIKLGKDILFLLALTCLFFLIRRKCRPLLFRHSPIWFSYVILILIVVTLVIVTMIRDGYWLALIGIRAHLALLAFLLGMYLTKNDIKIIWQWLKYLLILQMGFAVWSAINWTGSFSRHIFRLTGTFHNPNTLGLFCVSGLIFLFFIDDSVLSRWFYWGSTLILIIFTGSRSAIALALFVTIVYGFMHIPRARDRYIVAGIFLLCTPFLLTFLEWISGRPDVLFHLFSSGQRLGATWDYMQNAERIQILLGQGMGKGSNLGYLMQGVMGIPPVPGFDQLLGIEFVQGGLLLLVFTLFFILSPFLQFPYRFLSLVLPGVVLGASIAIPVWEAWPANILLLALYGYLWGGAENTYSCVEQCKGSR